MAFDTTTIITWASPSDQSHEELSVARDTILTTMIADGKTDGSFLEVTPVITVRYWLDLPAAQEFGAFIASTAATHNCNVISIEYGTRE